MSTKNDSDSSGKEILKKDKSEDSNDSGSAKIISNELLVGVYRRGEKMDELTSLEREIAQLHHVGPSTNLEYLEGDSFNTGNSALNDPSLIGSGKVLDTKSTTSKLNDYGNIDTRNDNFMQFCPEDETNSIKQEIRSTALEHEDLIAVLKGFDDPSITNIKEEKDGENRNMRPPSATESDLVEGVTIEGEGQFQIMEVVYDELDDIELSSSKESHKLPNIQMTSTSKSVSSTANSAISHLTNEEIRAMAMEQMAGLNAIAGDRQRKRKQEIKPLQVDESADLVTTLGAEWSEDDGEADVQTLSNVKSLAKSTSNSDSKNKKTDIVADQGGPNINSKDLLIKATDLIPKANKDTKYDEQVLSSIEEGSESVKNDEKDLKPVVGFKRTRVIKRKIIWDPDAPETQISYAQLARNSSKTNPGNYQTKKPSAQKISGVSILKSIRGDTSKNQNNRKNEVTLRGSESNISSTSTSSKTKGSTITPSSTNMESRDDTENVTEVYSSIKRRSQTPIINGSNKKKRVSEIDRLVSDEGAANMLHSLENERSKLIAEQGADKPHKPLMRSRASTISERILKRETTPTSATTINSGGTKTKRTPKQKPSSTWDYVYKQKASEDAMIIRRRSNSSYSSSASIRRLSLDAPASKSSNNSKTAFFKSGQHNTTSATSASGISKSSGTKTAQRSLLKSSNETNVNVKESDSSTITKASVSNSFEFVKPEMKSNQKGNRRSKNGNEVEVLYTNDIKMAQSNSRKGSRSPANIEDKDKTKSSGLNNKVSTKQSKEEISPGGSNISDVVVKKIAKVGQIVFNTQKAKINYTFTAQMLNKLADILDKLGKDADCNAVLITTTAPNFCYGIDFTDLTIGTVEKRKLSAVNLASAVKNYLKTLASFPKPLIAGVNGSNIGLGVMQLPLFDIVIGSDKGSYETPYVKIGQVPEGYCFWSSTTKIRDNYKTKLLWLGDKIHSTESALSGLVHKLTASSKVNDDALHTAKKVAMMSTETYRFMKKTLVNNNLETINNALDKEFDTIIEQWTSVECYDNLKKFVEKGHF